MSMSKVLQGQLRTPVGGGTPLRCLAQISKSHVICVEEHGSGLLSVLTGAFKNLPYVSSFTNRKPECAAALQSAFGHFAEGVHISFVGDHPTVYLRNTNSNAHLSCNLTTTYKPQSITQAIILGHQRSIRCKWNTSASNVASRVRANADPSHPTLNDTESLVHFGARSSLLAYPSFLNLATVQPVTRLWDQLTLTSHFDTQLSKPDVLALFSWAIDQNSDQYSDEEPRFEGEGLDDATFEGSIREREIALFHQALTWEGYLELSPALQKELRIKGVQWVNEELVLATDIAVEHFERLRGPDEPRSDCSALMGAYLQVQLDNLDY